MIFILFLLVVCVGLFSGYEMGYISVDKIKLRYLANTDKRAHLMWKLLSEPENFLSAMLIGTNVCIVIASCINTYLFIESNLFLADVILNLGVFFLGEIIPKFLFRKHNLFLSLKLVNFMNFIYKLLLPLVKLFNNISEFILGKYKIKESFLHKDELLSLLEQARREGKLDKDIYSYLESAIRFYETKVKDILTPKSKMIYIKYPCTKEDIISILNKHKYSRFPVIDKSQNKVLGILYVKDVVKFWDKINTQNIKNILREVYYINPEISIYEAFKNLKDKKVKLAMVEGDLGLITLEDILEEVVGEFEEAS
jgi:putative hemolysin